jgi:hypothetical protein
MPSILTFKSFYVALLKQVTGTASQAVSSSQIFKVFASFKPPTGREQARHVRRGKGRI